MELKSNAVLTIIVCVIIVCAAVAIAYVVSAELTTHKRFVSLIKNGVPASAIVTSFRGEGRAPTVRIQFEYMIRSGDGVDDKFHGVGAIDPRLINKPLVGDAVPIIYDAANPNSSVLNIDGQFERRVNSGYTMIATLVICAGILMIAAVSCALAFVIVTMYKQAKY